MNLHIMMTSLIYSPDDTEAAEPETIRLKLIQAEEATVNCQHQQWASESERTCCTLRRSSNQGLNFSATATDERLIYLHVWGSVTWNSSSWLTPHAVNLSFSPEWIHNTNSTRMGSSGSTVLFFIFITCIVVGGRFRLFFPVCGDYFSWITW